MSERGMWGMYCFNALSPEQQKRVVEWGNLPMGYKPEGDCPNGAEVEITTMYDKFPGPRFYCMLCGGEYLMFLALNSVSGVPEVSRGQTDDSYLLTPDEAQAQIERAARRRQGTTQ